ncbi:MAG TPA: hypothetical protein VIP78_02610 [Candidatus Dormibacteraeota bacterium]
MRNLLRQPLTWMVIAECVVVTLLIVVVWNVVAAAAATSQHSAAPSTQGVDMSPASSTPSLPDVPQAAKPATPVQLPGLNLNAGFWRVRLGQVNSEQVVFEQLEWRLVHSAMDAAQAYIDTVVLPSITRAERA